MGVRDSLVRLGCGSRPGRLARRHGAGLLFRRQRVDGLILRPVLGVALSLDMKRLQTAAKNKNNPGKR